MTCNKCFIMHYNGVVSRYKGNNSTIITSSVKTFYIITVFYYIVICYVYSLTKL